MAKGQKRGNREAKKPKKNKALAADPAGLAKASPVAIGVPRKKP